MTTEPATTHDGPTSEVDPTASVAARHRTAGLLDTMADAMADPALRFGHLVPASARRPSAAYVRSLDNPFGADDDELLDESDEHVVGEAEGTAPIESRSHRRDTLITTVVGLATYGLSLFTGPLLARSLGVADRGTYAAVWTPTQILGWLLMLGIPAATTYYARHDNRRQLDNTAWILTAVVGLPTFAVLWPLVPLFLHRHPPEAVFWFRLFLAAMLLVLPMQNCYEYLRARGHNTKFNVYRSIPLVLTTVFVVGLFLAGALDLRSALFATFLANVIGALLIIGIEGSVPRFSRATFDRQLFKLQVNYGLRVWVGTLSNMVLARFDQFLMVGIVAPEQLGLYAIAVTAAGMSAPVAQGVGFALFPFLRRDEDPVARNMRMWQGFRWVLIGSLAICGALALVVPWGLPALFGPEFKDSVAPFFVLLPGQVMWNLAQVFKTRLDADNRPGAGSNSLALAALVTLVGVPAVVPTWGIMGASVITTISQTVFCLTGWWFVHRGGAPKATPSSPSDAADDMAPALAGAEEGAR